MTTKQEHAQWIEDASGVWHFLLGGVDGPLVANICRDDSPNAPAGTYVGEWYKRGKTGGLIAGTNLAALKLELVKAYLRNATPAMRKRIRDGLNEALAIDRVNQLRQAEARAEWVRVHYQLHDFAALEAARVK